MKKNRYFNLMMLVICMSITLISCDKTNPDVLEGTWGLVHLDLTIYSDGQIQSETSHDYNPFSPSHATPKIAIINTGEERVLLSCFWWNSEKSSWVNSGNSVFTISGDSFIFEETEKNKKTSIGAVIPGASAVEMGFFVDRVDNNFYFSSGDLILESRYRIRANEVQSNKFRFRKMDDSR